ncbi:MAG: hypothetical protein LBH43_14140 [Treponema sp.]|jgi:hypothetical protein|nr:hypothetical protein [Treponema sp.]
MKNLFACGKKPLIFLTAFSVLIGIVFSALIISCGQAALFANISNEDPPIKPGIPGSLTNIVIAKEGPAGEEEPYLYAAGIGSKTIRKYKDGSWEKINAPGGKAIALASGGEDLYALGGEIMKPGLYKKKPSAVQSAAAEWDLIDSGEASGYSLESIYCAGDMLFAGGRNNVESKYGIFYIDTAAKLKSISEIPFDNKETPMPGLNGAAELGGIYYIAAGSYGILEWVSGSASSAGFAEEDAKANVTGIMNIAGQIIAVTRGGSVLQLSGGKFESKASGPSFTGGMCVWEKYDEAGKTWKPELLLLGVHSSERYNKGYREIALNSTGEPDFTSPLDLPGRKEISSVSNKNKYDNSLARYSVFSIMQVPNHVEDFSDDGSSAPAIFAATVNGLQSLRDGIWNAEE